MDNGGLKAATVGDRLEPLQLTVDRLRPLWRRTSPPWLRTSPLSRLSVLALLGFAVARILNLIEFAGIARFTKGHTLGSVLVSWDGRWYLKIAHHGYPSALQYGPDGHVRQSALAFFPLYPALVGGIGRMTQLPFGIIAVGISLICGSFAAIGIVWLLEPRLGGGTALTASLIWSNWVSAPVMAMAYSEALFTAEIVAILLLLLRRRYGWVAALLPLAALTRGSFPPLVAVLAVHAVMVLHGTERGRRLRALRWPGALVAWGALWTPVWPLYVGWRVGQADAYVSEQRAWKHDYSPLASWGRAIGRFGDGHSMMNDVIVLVVLMAAVLAVTGLFTRLDWELKVLAPVALLYLMTVLEPTASFLRFLLPFVTVPAVLATWLRSWAARIGVIVLLAVTQLWWIRAFLVTSSTWHPSL